VAIRYTTVRRQGEPDSNGLERQVLTYPSTYYRLLPVLSRAFVFIELGRYTVCFSPSSVNLSAHIANCQITALDEMQQRLANRDTSLLSEMHALLCGLKVLVSTHGVSDIETARRSMGGHGYSAFAGLGRLYVDYLPAVTWVLPFGCYSALNRNSGMKEKILSWTDKWYVQPESYAMLCFLCPPLSPIFPFHQLTCVCCLPTTPVH